MVSWALVWTLGCHFKTNVTRNLLIVLLGPIWCTRGRTTHKVTNFAFFGHQGAKSQFVFTFSSSSSFSSSWPMESRNENRFQFGASVQEILPKTCFKSQFVELSTRVNIRLSFPNERYQKPSDWWFGTCMIVGNQKYVETPQLAIASYGCHWTPCKMPNPPYSLGKNVKFGSDCSNALLILFPS